MGDLKEPLLGRIGAAERPFFVAEKLAFQQIFRQRGTVQVHPGLRRSHRIMMDSPRDDLFPCAAFAGDENSRVGDGDFLHQCQQPLHDVTGEDGWHSYEFASEHE